MSKRHREDVTNIPLSTNSKLGNELKRVPTRSVRFILLYHMGKEFVLMSKRKIICEFRGWRITTENSRGLPTDVVAKLHEIFI